MLKLLYLIRYIDDIPSNLDNIVILMADDIRVDKIIMREAARGCLCFTYLRIFMADSSDS